LWCHPTIPADKLRAENVISGWDEKHNRFSANWTQFTVYDSCMEVGEQQSRRMGIQQWTQMKLIIQTMQNPN
jgi:hypothetical protein